MPNKYFQFSMDDGLPNKLCKKCASDIVNAYSLKIKCEKSQAWLEKTLREYNPHLNVCLVRLKYVKFRTHFDL